jgi:hypothetical protein
MSRDGRQAFVRELQDLRTRGRRRGTLALTASFCCEEEACPVVQVTVLVEEDGGTKPMQPPACCPRRRGEMASVGESVDKG